MNNPNIPYVMAGMAIILLLESVIRFAPGNRYKMSGAIIRLVLGSILGIVALLMGVKS